MIDLFFCVLLIINGNFSTVYKAIERKQEETWRRQRCLLILEYQNKSFIPLPFRLFYHIYALIFKNINIDFSEFIFLFERLKFIDENIISEKISINETKGIESGYKIKTDAIDYFSENKIYYTKVVNNNETNLNFRLFEMLNEQKDKIDTIISFLENTGFQNQELSLKPTDSLKILNNNKFPIKTSGGGIIK